MEQARFDEAAAALEESLTLARELGMKPYIAPFLDSLACVAVEQGEYDRAGALFAEGLTLSHEMGITWVALYILGHMAELAAKQGKVERAVRLGGAEAAARQERGMFIVPVEQEHREQALRRARVKLGEESFHQAWTEGQAMSLEEAVAFALGESQDKSFSASLSSAGRQ
jgi:non-specific serine/threonine protein kinase